MASHFKWYPSSEEVIVPWNARYSFPSQANKAVKLTPRIPPKNGGTFNPGQVIRLEFPAQGYVNPLTTTIEFDVVLKGHDTATEEIVRFQNNIQSIFSRVRLLYGATPLEDIINYNTVVRCLTEWTGTNQNGTLDQCSIAEGIGGYAWGSDAASAQGNVNVRQRYVQGIATLVPGTAGNIDGGTGYGPIPQNSQAPSGATLSGVYRRYQVGFALGLFTQDKLIPTKFMASQLAIEITLEQAAGCIFVAATNTVTGNPNYQVCNVNLIPEILEFDASYDAMFLKGLREGGVPIKFSSWHTYLFSSSKSSNLSLMIQERSRSVKALFAVQRRTQPTFTTDSGATFFDTAVNGASTLQSYQYRIGGRYFPASPVQCAAEVGSAVNNGGAEAFLELQKALNVVGDYRLSSSVHSGRWAIGASAGGLLPEYDYRYNLGDYTTTGIPVFTTVESTTNAFSGTLGSAAFAMAIDLETSNGVEISGLNAEEQSDIALLCTYRLGQSTGSDDVASSIEVYTYYDAMIVLRENNVLELIQ